MTTTRRLAKLMTSNSSDGAMILRCLTNQGKAPGPTHRGLYYTERSAFQITPGDSYEVHGLALFNGGLIVLLKDAAASPNWYPIDLFDTVDGSLPANWKFSLREGGEDGLQALIGYQRLVDDPSHFEALIEREPNALEFFNRQTTDHG